MSQIQWDEKLSVGIREIDDQHKELIKMINRLDEAVADGSWTKKVVTLSDVLLEMVAYLDYHFSTEEKYMIEYDYPDYDDHRDAHLTFVRDVTDFTEAFRNGKKGLSVEILDYLKEWYLSHITSVDAKYGSYLRDRGLA